MVQSSQGSDTMGHSMGPGAMQRLSEVRVILASQWALPTLPRLILPCSSQFRLFIITNRRLKHLNLFKNLSRRWFGGGMARCAFTRGFPLMRRRASSFSVRPAPLLHPLAVCPSPPAHSPVHPCQPNFHLLFPPLLRHELSLNLTV